MNTNDLLLLAKWAYPSVTVRIDKASGSVWIASRTAPFLPTPNTIEPLWDRDWETKVNH